MKINEILVESQQIDEGPLGSAVKAVGRGVGKAIGGVAKAAGAVAGVAQGAKTAFQKGKQASIDVIGGTRQGADVPAAQPTAQPAAAPAAQPAAAPSAQAINKAGPKGTAMAKQQTGKAAQAMKQTAQAMAGQPADQAGQTLYAQVKSQINQLDKKGKQRILQLLQKSLQQPAQPSAAPAGRAQPAAPKRGAPIKVSGTQKPQVAKLLQPTTQTAGKIDNRPSINESFSLYRKK